MVRESVGRSDEASVGEFVERGALFEDGVVGSSVGVSVGVSVRGLIGNSVMGTSVVGTLVDSLLVLGGM
eukprot:scaffold139217_cov79-Attheya_sp.AAC.1